MYKLLSLALLTSFLSITVLAEQGAGAMKIIEKKASRIIDQEIYELNDDQLNDIKQWEEIGKYVIAHYGIDTASSIYENLDIVYEKWINDKQKKPSEGEVILGLGTIFGDRIRSKHNSSWKLATSEEYGDNFVIVLKSGQQIYPMDFVAKRVYGGGKELGFFSGMNAVLDKQAN